MTEGSGGPGRRAAAAAVAASLVAAALAYLPAVGGEFHWDDVPAVLTRARVVDPSLFGWRDFVPPALGSDRSLTDLTFAANHALSGDANAPFVATNLAIHLVAVVLAFAVARAILRRAGHPRAEALAAVAAALFALHPMQTEAVSFVSQRAESLASALYLAALLLWLRADEEHPGGGRRGWIVAGALVSLAALAAKPIAITLPVAFLAIVAATGRPGPRSAAFRAGVAAAIAGAAALGVAALRALGASRDAGLEAGDLGPWRYLLTEAGVVPRYLWLLAWPADQSVDPHVRASPGLADPRTLAGVAFLAALLGGALWLARRGRRSGDAAAQAASAGILWYLVLLGPTSSLVPLADPMAEHRTYLANLGIFLAAVAGVDALLRRLWPERMAARAGAALAAAALAALGGALVQRNRLWHDELSLWLDAARKGPLHYRPQLHAGNALWSRGRTAEALAYYGRAAQVVPPGHEQWAPVHRVLGERLAESGRPGEAVPVLEEVVVRVPGDLAAREALAWTRYQVGDLDGAVREVWKGRALGLDSGELSAVAGKAAANRGDVGAALRELRHAVALAPGSSRRRSDLAIVARMAGQADLACIELARFVALEGEAAARVEGERLRRDWGCDGRREATPGRR